MSKLDADTIKALEAFGIVSPARSPWRRCPSGGDKHGRLYVMTIVCGCGNQHRQVPLIPFEHGGRRLLIGQCQGCGEITWEEYPAAVTYPGPRTLAEARAMLNRNVGQGPCTVATKMQCPRHGVGH